MQKRKAAKMVCVQIERIAEAMGYPSDLRVTPVGKEGLSHLLYLNSLVDDETVAWATDQFAAFTAVRTAGLELPVRGRLRPLDGSSAAVEVLLEGNLVVVNGEMLAVEAQGWLKREPQEPETERVIRGPREGFTETLADNIGLVRRWIRDPSLQVEELRVGRRTKTRVVLVYLADVAPPRMVSEVRRRLEALDLDGILESGYIQQLITDRRASIFPLIQATERSDRIAAGILEGRVAILVDKSTTSLLVPVTINELYQTPEDYYLSFWVGSFLRLIRLLGNNLAVALPGLYIAVTDFHPELLPTQLALAIAGTRTRVPVPLLAELFIMEIAAALFGLHGLTIAGILVLVHAADLKSFGVSYLAPWAPLQWEELGDAPVRKPFWARWHRPETYRPRNKLRTGGTKREDDEDDA
jgi:hypothetical protein